MRRRRFLTGCAACAGSAGFMKSPFGLGAAQSANTPAKSAGKVKIRVLYALHKEKQDQPDWPNVGYDFRPVMDRIDKELAARLPGFEFTRALSTGAEQTKKIVADDKDVDGYLVCQMNCWNQVAQTAATTGQARPLRRSSIRRKRRFPRLLGRVHAGRGEERRVRSLGADRRPRRRRPPLRAGQSGGAGIRLRRGRRPGAHRSDSRERRSRRCSGTGSPRSPRPRPSGG